MAQIVAAVEAALQGLRGLQASGAAPGDSSRLEAWEHDLREREAEFQRRSEQLQLTQIDATRQEEAAATQERRHGAEATALAAREAELLRMEAETTSREAALDARAQDLAGREEAARREMTAAAVANDRAAVVQQEARDRASAVALDAAAKVR